ncbi:MAG TPA: glycoside hydrolase family 2 [Candidatus Ornithocaccomicrobium faecavium]|uniref:Glycoside hydrolase family 2 n=1 Tax=Candidatus Ornithocaccomicrobium faecavium TaxID=2840890 RepID=A0A9D1TCM1_9FIRM|nr:glycoside hydrolase family 2 [Candidatus Ornithocaccomicrobium faecavium]
MHAIPKPEFPRPEKRRENWLNLNGQWDFRLFPAGAEEAEKSFAANRSAYDRAIAVPFSWVCPLSGVEEDVAGIGWYRRAVSYQKKNRLFLCFGAVDYKADVYINGTHAGSHQGGYSYFEMEITALWREGENIIEVRAEDYRRETQLYGKQGYGEIQGIWQTVWLEDRPQAYIQDWQVVTRINGEVEITVQADAADGSEICACFGGQCWRSAVRQGAAKLSLTMENPRLWSPDSPYLYEGSLKLGDDEVFTYFGIREIRAGNVDGRGYKWILLNGKPIYLNGTLDQAFHPRGHFTYPSDQDMYDEAWRLKRLGLNMVRIHIKPEEPRKLYWMDKLGILVMEDIPCFWGEPIAEARAAYEAELPEIIARDINHPATFAWVVFNESWGLLHGKRDDKVYLPETQEWVRSIYHKAKALDPHRIVEDNSPCRYDHVETDLNTWHFYLNGYEIVRDHIRKVVEETYPGSSFNFIGENRQTDAPLMNSECGMVWGVDGSAGDSDLAWQYHYMLNEYRLHEKLCGFVFTEFHDVVNEFNGYYRIDNTDKDFGYQDFCRGMSLCDLHAADFLAVDCPPMQTVAPGAAVAVPLVLSSFSDAHHGETCSVEWELWHDGLQGRICDGQGVFALPEFGWGTTSLPALTVTMPQENAAAVLSLYLKDSAGNVIMRNFTTFDVQAALPETMVEIPVCQGKTQGFALVWNALMDDKLCMGGEGEVSYEITLPAQASALRDLTIYLEASSKRVLSKDRKDIGAAEADLGFMRGYRVDRGAFENSYWMTDESRLPSTVDVLINGEAVQTLFLENDWADARGMLSWHRQPNPRKLDEAGSFGEQKRIAVPSRLLPGIQSAGKFTLTLRVRGEGGLALYGRNSGRYPHGLLIETTIL